MTPTFRVTLRLALLIGVLAGCHDNELAQLRQENASLVNDTHRLEHEATDLRARLERTRIAIDSAQDKLDAALSALEALPDAAANVAAKLDDAADALDDASDAIDGEDDASPSAPITVRTLEAMPASGARLGKRGAGEFALAPLGQRCEPSLRRQALLAKQRHEFAQCLRVGDVGNPRPIETERSPSDCTPRRMLPIRACASKGLTMSSFTTAAVPRARSLLTAPL